MNLNALAERRWLPDSLIRYGIRNLLGQRAQFAKQEVAKHSSEKLNQQFAAEMRTQSMMAFQTDAANQQHYEVPTRLYELSLGPRLKYSSGYWPEGVSTLAESEEAMLKLTADRLNLQPGMSVLELGCGWGSLTLWMAEHYPDVNITAMSNSATQREYITRQAEEKGLHNLEVITADINEFVPSQRFDRVVSVEMFEHVRNHALLFKNIASWLEDRGEMVVHVFCHRHMPYLFETGKGNDWMSRHFFSGGMMPSEHLFAQYDEHLSITDQWWISGTHYAKTCRAWLDTLDANYSEAVQVLADHPDGAMVQAQRWRMFYMACEELFAYRANSDEPAGETWGVAHYRFVKSR